MYEEEIALMSDFSGADSMFSDDDEEDDDDMVTDESEWEDVDDGNDSVYSIPPTRANLSASGMCYVAILCCLYSVRPWYDAESAGLFPWLFSQ